MVAQIAGDGLAPGGQGHTGQEIGLPKHHFRDGVPLELVDCPVNTVRSRLNRARARLGL